jgi:branched-chain amino acid transport system permease protein
MDLSIASILLLDGLTNGAVYALLGLATVLVFAVTRVIFIPQGEFVTYGALTLAILQTGQVPGTVWLLMLLAALAALAQCWQSWQRHPSLGGATVAGLKVLAPPLAIALITLWAAPLQFSLLVQAALSVAIVTCFGPLVYRLAYQSLADASSLVLLIVSVGVHFTHHRPGLPVFWRGGFSQPTSFWDARFQRGRSQPDRGQAVIIVAVSSTALMLHAVVILRAHAVWQGTARHRRQPAGRAPDGHLVSHGGGSARRFGVCRADRGACRVC